MGSIFQDIRIRERQGTGGKALVYQPHIPPGKSINTALEAHEKVWGWLGARDRLKASPRWMKDLISRCMDAKKGEWETVFNGFLDSLEVQEYTPKPKGETEEEDKNPLKDPQSLESVIRGYNREMALDHHSVGFPMYAAHKSRIRGMIAELLERETLMDVKGGKVPCDSLVWYRETLKDPKLINDASRRIRDIQVLISFGNHWKEFCSHLDPKVTHITELKKNHGRGFQAWRIATREHGEEGKKIAHLMIKREITYMRNAIEWAIDNDLAQKNPLREFNPRELGKDQEEEEVEKPFTISEVQEILKWAYKTYKESPEGNERDIQRKKDRKLNWLTMVFLACVGCRPKEVNQFTLKNGQLSFTGGKTANARRVIPPTPTVSKIVHSSFFKENGNTVGIAQRVSQYMQRNMVKKYVKELGEELGEELGKERGKEKGMQFTVYRFRHFAATIRLFMGEDLQSIAYIMGHSSSQVTEEKYGRMKVLIEGGGKESAKKFWTWLNEGYFQTYPM